MFNKATTQNLRFDQIIASIIALIMFAPLSVLVAGCEKAETGPTTALCLVVDQSLHTEHISSSDTSMKEICSELITNGGLLSCVLVSKEPEALGSTVKISAPKNSREEALQARWDDVDGPFSILRKIDSAVPPYEELDYLESLKAAASALNTQDAAACDKRTLVIVGPGLSTAGIIDMTGEGSYGDILNTDYDALVAAIAEVSTSDAAEHENLPRLDNIKVLWYGCGQLIKPDSDYSE